MSLRKGFDSTVLPELSPFQLIGDADEAPTKTEHVSNDGKRYDTYTITVKPKNVTDTFEIDRLFKRDYDRIRVLQIMAGDKGFISASWKLKTTEEGFDQLIFALAK